MTTFTWQLKDTDNANATTLNVSRADFNWSSQIKTFSPATAPDNTTRANPTTFDFGRKIEGFVLYGVMTSYDEAMALRTKLNGKYWEKKPAKLFISSGDSHEGQVAEFKVYMDRKTGGEYMMTFVLTFVIASAFKISYP